MCTRGAFIFFQGSLLFYLFSGSRHLSLPAHLSLFSPQFFCLCLQQCGLALQVCNFALSPACIFKCLSLVYSPPAFQGFNQYPPKVMAVLYNSCTEPTDAFPKPKRKPCFRVPLSLRYSPFLVTCPTHLQISLMKKKKKKRVIVLFCLASACEKGKGECAKTKKKSPFLQKKEEGNQQGSPKMGVYVFSFFF